MSSIVQTESKIFLPFLHKSHIIENIEILKNYVEQESGKKFPLGVTLKEKYFEAINYIQDVPVPYSNEKIHVTYFDKTLQNKLLSLGMIDKEDLENDKHIYSQQEQEVITDRIEKALKLIKVLHNDLYDLINTLIGTFLILKKDLFGGGSVSNVMGLVWLNPQSDWSIIEYAEAIYHEFIHQSIFLDDMINCMFPNANECAKEEALVTSTILKIKRPLDRAYHAAGVSIGIMHLYHLFNDSKNSDKYMDDLRKTVEEIEARTQFLGEQGVKTLEIMRKFINHPSFDDITYSLQN
ncbi:HEXXH motif-containing putative peptide modification protein [Geobacillus sp. FSL W8-0032]|uniref:HEXXH motif domain-containing protein n=1 Tax=Geobacillus icigianus TaxID=1430331 RepID=A0ABU6BDS4_9BACL|nr:MULTISPECIES: HEXXH motif-containing putative peptide modification protein [Geobacillus]MEB3750073.1 hypothetical protein [Geobacillus icigianus]